MDRASLPIFLSVPFPAVNGITTYSMYLAQGLGRLGYPTRVLLTEADTTLATYREKELEFPANVAVERLPVSRLDGWGAHWGALIRLLHENAPCVYIPNSDFRHSVVSPALRPDVKVVGVAHADEPLHYDHVARLGHSWDWTVCVSSEVADQLRQRHPELADRISRIRNGIETPESYPQGRSFSDPLRMVYHGSFKQQQKRILHFPELLRTVRATGVDASLTLIGSGPDEEALRESSQDLVEAGVLHIVPPVPNEELRRQLADYHIYLLNSEFEGMPQALLEAMSQGCVPVVTDVSSGTREVVTDGENGFLVDVSDFDAFADRIARLDAGRDELKRMSRKAYQSLAARGLRLSDMAAAYDELFTQLVENDGPEVFRRVPGPIAAPPVRVDDLYVFPVPLNAEHPRHGRFPSWGDLEDFEWEGLSDRLALLERQRSRPLFLAVKDLGGSYSTELAIDMAEALRRQGHDTRLLCLRPPPPNAISPPAGLPVVTVCGQRNVGWAGAATRTLRLLEKEGECAYMAFDRDTACLAPRLSEAVRTIVLANTDDVGWLHASELPEHVDGLAFTSPAAESAAFPEGPPSWARVSVIPYPVHGLGGGAARREERELSVLAYLGHLDGRKPDLDALRAVLEPLAASETAVRLLLPVHPPDVEAAEAMLRELPGSMSSEVLEVSGGRALRSHLDEAHVLLVPVEFEDVSLVILEALAHGCVPVARRSPGLEGAVPEELSSELIDEKGAEVLAQRITELAGSRDRLRELAERTRRQLELQYPGPDAVAHRWVRMLARVWASCENESASRARLRDQHRDHPLLLAVSDLGSRYSSELAIDLARAFKEDGCDVRLFTMRPPPPRPFRAPSGVPLETVCIEAELPWEEAAERTIAQVERWRECTYLALDRETASLAPRLSSDVRSIVLANSDDVDWLLAGDLAACIDGLVFTSPDAREMAFPGELPPSLRASVIPHPVHVLPAPAPRREDRLTLLAYTGHLDGLELDLDPVHEIAAILAGAEIPMRFVLAVRPAEFDEAVEALRGLPEQMEVEVLPAASRPELLPGLEEAHILLLTTPLKWISLVLLDGLGHGCVGVGTKTPGMDAIPEEVAEGVVAEPGPAALAARVLELIESREGLSKLSERTRVLMELNHPVPRDVADEWIQLMSQVWNASEQTQLRRKPGMLFPPYPRDLEEKGVATREGLVHVPELGWFSHWGDWLEYRAGSSWLGRVAQALRSFARALVGLFRH